MLDKIQTFPSAPTDEKIADTLKELSYTRVDNWLETDFLTGTWWFQLAVAILSILVFWKLIDKKRLFEMSLYVLLASVIIIWLDQTGYELGFWYYPVDLIPLFPPSTAFDYSLLPLIYVLIYQYYPKWPSFLKATFIMSAIISFIMEPMAVRWGFYVLIKWKYYYGYPIYILIGVMLKLITEKIKKIVTKHQLPVK